MSNRAYLSSMEFKKLVNGKVTKGIRIYDDYGTYYTEMDEIPDDYLELLKVVLDEFYFEMNHEGINNLLDSIADTETGIDINDAWYDWDEINHLFFPEK